MLGRGGSGGRGGGVRWGFVGNGREQDPPPGRHNSSFHLSEGGTATLRDGG